MTRIRALTPKEFSHAIGGLLAPATIREKCKVGKLPTVGGPRNPPYFILPAALEPFRGDLRRFQVSASA